MQKDFDRWNKKKKQIDQHSQNRLYHEREIWWCAFGVNIGFEQDGTGDEGERPALILKGFSKDVCLVMPLTTSKKENPYHINLGRINGRDASVIISQVRLVDTKRLINKIGFIDRTLFNYIRKTIKDML